LQSYPWFIDCPLDFTHAEEERESFGGPFALFS
jgi:hypothetical protein